MAYGTVAVDPGSNPTINTEADDIGGAKVPAIKLLDPTPGSSTPIGTDANPMRVRARRRGTGSDYDSGSVVLTTGALVAITAATVYLLGGYVVNVANAAVLVTITDTAGAFLWNNFLLEPGQTEALPVGAEGQFVGLKGGCNVANGAQFRAWGTQ